MRHLSGLISSTLLLLAPFVQAQKLADDLQHHGSSGDVQVIVQFNEAHSGKHDDLIKRHGGYLRRTFHSLQSSAAYQLPAASLDAVANDPSVTHVSIDHVVRPYLDLTAAAVSAQAAWNAGYDGSGVDIALIDSGVTVNADLTDSNGRSRVDYSQSFVAGDKSTADAYGHGTHVAGILASSGALSTGPNYTRAFKGMAPNAHLINLRVLDQNGNGYESDVIAAIDRAIILKKKYNIRVINLSLGRPVTESFLFDPLCQEVEKAWNAGIVVVVAAGNHGRDNDQGQNGYGTITAPGNDPFVITVGAMKTMGTADTSDDLIATYSSKGPTAFDHIVKPDIVAPGNLVDSLRVPRSTLDVTYPQNRVPLSYYTNSVSSNASTNYFTLSGTSMATPVVAGAAALLLQQDPSLTPDLVKARLMKTARKSFPTSSSYTDPTTNITYTSYYDTFTVGAGYLDIGAAMANTDRPWGSAMSPFSLYDPRSGNLYLISLGFGSVVWGSAPGWDANTIYGAPAASPNSIAWGSTNPNGNSISWGSNNVPGDSIAWGSANPFGNSIAWGSINLLNNSIAWGSLSTVGNSIAWGSLAPVSSSINWGSNNPSSNSINWGSNNPSTNSINWGSNNPISNSINWGSSVIDPLGLPGLLTGGER